MGFLFFFICQCKIQVIATGATGFDHINLKERLKKRETETEESMNRRLDKAEFEMTFQHKFDRIIFNEDLEKAVLEAELLIRDFLKS